jgi:hypothetical protein
VRLSESALSALPGSTPGALARVHQLKIHPIRSAANRERVRGGLATNEGAKPTVGGFPETSSATGACFYNAYSQDDASAVIAPRLPITSRCFTVLVALSELCQMFLTLHLQVEKFFLEEGPLCFCPRSSQLLVGVQNGIEQPVEMTGPPKT